MLNTGHTVVAVQRRPPQIAQERLVHHEVDLSDANAAIAAAKAAIIDMTRTFSLELARDGITINVVAPGPVATDLFDNGHPIGSDKRQRVIESIPVRRVGTTDDVARALPSFWTPKTATSRAKPCSFAAAPA